MTRTGTRRARGAADAGSTTGVATAVLALLSAGALATLGLVTAGEISGGGFAGGLGLGPGAAPAPPGKVVVAGEQPARAGSGSRSGGSTGDRRTAGSGQGPAVVPPLVGLPATDAGTVLPTPAGIDSLPVPAAAPTALPGTDPAAAPGPGPAVVLPPPVDPGLRMATHGRSAQAPGHTRSTDPVVRSLSGRTTGGRPAAAPTPLPAATTAGRTVERPAVVLASATGPKAQQAAKGPVAKAPRPAAAASAAASAPGRLAHAPSSRGRSADAPGRAADTRGRRPATPAPVLAPVVVPTPAVTALGGPPAGDPPGLAKGRADR